MRKPEQKLADRVRKAIGHLVLIERIENSAGFGTPDACVLHPVSARVTWVEHKVATLPKRAGTRLQYDHPLTDEQKNWHLRWTSRRGHSLILIGCGTRLYAVPGDLADTACEYGPESMSKLFEVDYAKLVRIYQKGFEK